MLKLCTLLILLIVPAIVFGQASLNVRRCVNKPFPKSVRLAGCSSMPCSMRRSPSANFTIEFEATQRITSITILASRRVAFGVEQPYPLPAKVADGCANLIGLNRCPFNFVRTGTQLVALPLSPSMFNTPLSVTFRIMQRAQTDATISCFEVDLRTGVF